MMNNDYQIFDTQHWERREIYEHFSQLKLPHYSVAANIDVTHLLRFKRENNCSFYLSLVYLVTEAMNGIENFRLRVKDGQVVLYDKIHTNFTHKRPEEEVFRFYTGALEGTLREYVEATSAAIAQQTTLFGGMGDIENVVYSTCIPNLDTTAICNPGMENPDDAIPRVNWGKYVLREGRWQLNMTICANHRFIDGYHIGLFFQQLQTLIDELE
ncbi:MAG: hypothetical protein K6C10_01985 [Prevotella sp.]|nr:hypothetical protein [Prevotella sp.]